MFELLFSNFEKFEERRQRLRVVEGGEFAHFFKSTRLLLTCFVCWPLKKLPVSAIVTLCVVISGCFNFKSIKKSEGGIENAIWTILWLFMELGLDPPPISRLAHIVYQPK